MSISAPTAPAVQAARQARTALAQGAPVAADNFMLGLPFTSAAALEAGFVDELVPAYAMQKAVRRHCANLLALDTASFTATKRRLSADAIAAMANAVRTDATDWQGLGFGRAVA